MNEKLLVIRSQALVLPTLQLPTARVFGARCLYHHCYLVLPFRISPVQHSHEGQGTGILVFVSLSKSDRNIIIATMIILDIVRASLTQAFHVKASIGHCLHSRYCLLHFVKITSGKQRTVYGTYVRTCIFTCVRKCVKSCPIRIIAIITT